MKKTCVAILCIVTAACLFVAAIQRMVDAKADTIIHNCYDQAADEFLGFAQQDTIEPARINFDAPSVCEVGELVRIDLRQSTVATTLSVITIPDLTVTDDFEIIEDGKRAFFSSRSAGEFLVIVAGAKDSKPYLFYQRITVEGDTSSPTEVKLSSQVARWVHDVKAYDGRDKHGKALARVFAEFADSKDVDIDSMLESTAKANGALLGEDLPKWEEFLDRLGSKLDDYIDSDTLATRDDYSRVWKEIAIGIERGL